MPHIDSTRFGEVTVGKIRYRQVIIVGDKVAERDYDRLVGLFGTSHRIGDWEIEELLKGPPETIVIGTGQEGRLDVGAGLLAISEEKNIELVTALTPEAIKVYNARVREGRRVNALMHTTC